MNMSDMARSLGRKGGRARAKRLSATDKQRIASLGGRARLQSIETARRIAVNFQYVATVDALRGRPHPVARLRTFGGRLPGIPRADP